jgi:membrane protein YqaA with SNARE-associated domain
VHLLLDPIAWLVVVAFSVLGSVGNLALYQVGIQGVDAIRKRFPRIKPEHWQRVKRLYDKYGSWVLLLSGVPVLGSLLTTAAGTFGVPRQPFCSWSPSAKCGGIGCRPYFLPGPTTTSGHEFRRK